MTTEKKRFDYRHIICIVITLGFLACSVFLYSGALGRLIEGFRDFGLSVGYYFCEIFGIEHNIQPTVNNLPKYPFFDFTQTPAPSTPLPDTAQGFVNKWTAYWQLWATLDNFTGYLSFIGTLLFILCKVLIIALPFILLVYIWLQRYLKKQNNDYDKDSRPLKAYKWLTAHTYRPVKHWLVSFWAFLKEHKTHYILWAVVWAFNFNAITIVLEFLAYYLYFVVSFDVVNIYKQIYKLFLDLSVPLTAIPVWLWVIIGLVVFDRYAKI